MLVVIFSLATWGGVLSAAGFDPTEDLLASVRTMQVGDGDWPQWGGSSRRNNTPSGTNIPHRWDVVTGENLLWSMPLGSQTFGTPAVANGRVFVGTNNAHGYVKRYPAPISLGALIAFDEKVGKFLWQASTPPLATGRANFNVQLGTCSTPYCEANRIWYVTGRGEVVCLDAEGFHDGENDGPYNAESNENQDEDDLVWRFDMMADLGVSQHNRSTCSVTCLGDYCFVITGNGVDESHVNIPSADAPSFICLNKSTGKLVWTDNTPGRNVLHGQWSSPCAFHAGGRDQVVMGGGDGWIYSFDPAGDGAGKSRLLWKFDGNPKASVYVKGGGNEIRGRSPIVATPVFYDGYVYVGMGEDPEYGGGASHLYCIDPTRDGDVSIEVAVDSDGEEVLPKRLMAIDTTKGQKAIPNPNSALRWHYDNVDRNRNDKVAFDETMHRTVCSVVIKNDLLIVPDLSGIVHCLDAKREDQGKPVVYWTHDMFSSVVASPLAVENKVYICDEDGDVVVFELSKEHHILAENHFDQSIKTTPVVANDTLYIASRNRLYALRSGAKSSGSETANLEIAERSSNENTSRQEVPSGSPSEELAASSTTPSERPASPDPAATLTSNEAVEERAAASMPPEDRIESSDILLVETKEGLAAYSMSLGKWDTLNVNRPRSGQSRLKKATLGPTFACVVIDEQLFGFSSKVGRWAKLPIPADEVGQVSTYVGQNMLSATIGDRTYVLSSKTGEWTSPDAGQSSGGGDTVETTAIHDAEQKLRLALDSPEARRVLEEIAKHESRSARQAEQIRRMLKLKPTGEPESATILEARRELEATLAKALELKTQVEQWRVRDLQARLSRMEQQIGQRKAQSAQIVKRRAFELIEGDETEWNAQASASTATPTEQPKSRAIGTVSSVASPAIDPQRDSRPAAERPESPAAIPRKASPAKQSPANFNNNNHKKPNEFFVMNEDGTDLHSLYLFDGHPLVGSPAVSPDGQWIAFDEATPGNAENVHIYVMGIDGGMPQRICSGLMPTWFSDNRFLLCTRREPRYGVWRVDRETQEKTFLRPALGGQMSPDGTRIAVNFTPELAVFDLRTSTSRTIVGGRSNPFVHIVSNGTWSPDGKSFCFVGVRSSGVRDICTTTMTGINDIANLKKHYSFQDNIMTRLAWHPSGQRVLFSGICPSRKGLKQLYEFDPNKPGTVELVAGQDPTRNNLEMTWTPDGKRLIFVSGDYCED